MRTTISFLMLVVSCNLAAASNPKNPGGTASGPAPVSDFTLVRENEHIRIYSRWLQVNETRSARQLKAEFTVDGTIGNVMSVIHDDQGFTQWMNNTESYCRLKTISPINWYSYIRFSVPWPLDDQDCILHYQVQEISPGETHVLITGEPKLLKEMEDVKRISHMEVKWIFKKTGENQTHVEYYVFSRQISSFPRMITDPIIQNSLLKSMIAFCEMVKEGRQP